MKNLSATKILFVRDSIDTNTSRTLFTTGEEFFSLRYRNWMAFQPSRHNLQQPTKLETYEIWNARNEKN